MTKIIPITIEGERRLKNGERTGNFSLSKEFARAFFDMQEQAAEKGIRIGMGLIIEKAEVMPVDKVVLSDIHDDIMRIAEKIEGHLKPQAEGTPER